MATTKRRAIPIRRCHADDTTCTHRISSSGRPRDGEDCSGVAGYEAACKCGCGWTYRSPIRAVVEEKRSLYRNSHPQQAADDEAVSRG